MMRKLITVLLLGALLLSVVSPVYGEDRTPVAWGIDVSSYQGRINWDLAQKDTNFAIIRCGYGKDYTYQDDNQWYNNVNACTRLGIPFGAYLFSYAITEEDARSEARHAIRLLEGYHPTMPVYLDVEHYTILEGCTPEQILRNVTIFCDMIREAGYTPGVYSCAEIWETYLTLPQYDRWERWIAQYRSELHYSRPYSMWQHTNQGTIRGIDGHVDLNYWYGRSLSSQGCQHSYTYYTAQEAGCTTSGRRVYTCSKCGYRYEETIPPYGHQYKQTVIPPTCNKEGFTYYECQCGDHYRANEKSATGHNMYMMVAITQQPTQTQGGTASHYCRKCNEVMWIERLPSIGDHMAKCPSAVYEDVPPYLHWAHDYIDDALQRDIFRGVGENKFQPEGAMTRAMTVTVLWRMDGCPEPKSSAVFSDVASNQWYAKAVAWAQENGIVNGVGQGRFDPMGIVSREQLVTILYRYSGYLGWNQPDFEDVLYLFPDEDRVSGYAKDAYNWAVMLGIISGSADGETVYLNPKGIANRMQAAKIIVQWARG